MGGLIGEYTPIDDLLCSTPPTRTDFARPALDTVRPPHRGGGNKTLRAGHMVDGFIWGMADNLAFAPLNKTLGRVALSDAVALHQAAGDEGPAVDEDKEDQLERQ